MDGDAFATIVVVVNMSETHVLVSTDRLAELSNIFTQESAEAVVSLEVRNGLGSVLITKEVSFPNVRLLCLSDCAFDKPLDVVCPKVSHWTVQRPPERFLTGGGSQLLQSVCIVSHYPVRWLTFPLESSAMENLRQLQLRGVMIEDEVSLWSRIQRCSHLETLVLRACGLTRLPEQWNLAAHTLCSVDVRSNNLRGLPAILLLMQARGCSVEADGNAWGVKKGLSDDLLLASSGDSGAEHADSVVTHHPVPSLAMLSACVVYDCVDYSSLEEAGAIDEMVTRYLRNVPWNRRCFICGSVGSRLLRVVLYVERIPYLIPSCDHCSRQGVKESGDASPSSPTKARVGIIRRLSIRLSQHTAKRKGGIGRMTLSEALSLCRKYSLDGFEFSNRDVKPFYVRARTDVASGKLPVNASQAVILASLQLRIEEGAFSPNFSKALDRFIPVLQTNAVRRDDVMSVWKRISALNYTLAQCCELYVALVKHLIGGWAFTGRDHRGRPAVMCVTRQALFRFPIESTSSVIVCPIWGVSDVHHNLFDVKIVEIVLDNKAQSIAFSCSNAAEMIVLISSLRTAALKTPLAEEEAILWCSVCEICFDSDIAFRLHGLHCQGVACGTECPWCSTVLESEYKLRRHCLSCPQKQKIVQ